MITNKHGLPDSFLRAVENIRANHVSSGAFISVTSLIDSPRVVRLRNLFRDQIEEDVMDNYLALLGSGVHSILEEAYEGSDGVSVEEMFMSNVEINTSMGTHYPSLAGKIDLCIFGGEDGNSVDVYDYKTISVMSHKLANGKVKTEWEQQMNVYAYLLRKSKYNVKSLNIVPVFRDWNRNKVYEHGYPNIPIMNIPVRKWSARDAEDYVTARMELHFAASKINDEMLLKTCSPSEMWERKTTFAVKDGSKKRAVRVFDTATEAINYTNKKDSYWLEERRGSRVRCESFCSVAPFCTPFKEYNDNG